MCDSQESRSEAVDIPQLPTNARKRWRMVSVTVRTVIRASTLARVEKSGNIRVIAQASTFDKILVVRSLKQNGHVVAATGDSIGDAIVLREADVDLSLGTRGSRQAKENSDVIILEDNIFQGKQRRKMFWGIIRVIILLQVVIVEVWRELADRGANLEAMDGMCWNCCSSLANWVAHRKNKMFFRSLHSAS